MPWGKTLHQQLINNRPMTNSLLPITRALDRKDQSIDVFRENMTDLADAEAIDACDFSGINHEAFFFESVVEYFEVVVWRCGIMWCGE
jgi:hypothetical protein